MRTVVLTPLQRLDDAIAVAHLEGWIVLLARRVPSGVELTLGR